MYHKNSTHCTENAGCLMVCKRNNPGDAVSVSHRPTNKRISMRDGVSMEKSQSHHLFCDGVLEDVVGILFLKAFKNPLNVCSLCWAACGRPRLRCSTCHVTLALSRQFLLRTRNFVASLQRSSNLQQEGQTLYTQQWGRCGKVTVQVHNTLEHNTNTLQASVSTMDFDATELLNAPGWSREDFSS